MRELFSVLEVRILEALPVWSTRVGEYGEYVPSYRMRFDGLAHFILNDDLDII